MQKKLQHYIETLNVTPGRTCDSTINHTVKHNECGIACMKDRMTGVCLLLYMMKKKRYI
jgi:hypothetical protein